MSKREEYYRTLKNLSSGIKKEWKEITTNNRNSYVVLSSFANKLKGTLTEVKKERERTIDDIDTTNQLLSTTSTIRRAIVNDLKTETKEIAKQNIELNKQKSIYDKIRDFTKNIKDNLNKLNKFGKLDISIEGAKSGKNILQDTLNSAINSIKGLVPLVKTVVILLSGILNSIFKNVANGISAIFESVSEKGLRGLRSGAKQAKQEFNKIGTDIENVIDNAKKIFETLKEIQELEKQVEARRFGLEIAQNSLDVFEKQKELLETTNLTLQERLDLLSKQYAFEINLISANTALINSQKELAQRELFIASVKKESTVNKQAEINLLNSELSKLNAQSKLLKQVFQIETQLTIIRDIGTKTNFDRIAIINGLEREIKQLQSTVQQGFLLEKEVELTNKALDKLKENAKTAFQTLKDSAKIDLDVDRVLNDLQEGLDPELFKKTLLNKGLNKDVIDELVNIYSNYYDTITQLQENASEKNREIVERNKQAIIEAIELEFEAQKTAIDDISNKYLDYKQILQDIQDSNVDIFTKTIQSVNVLKRGFIELGKQYDDNLAKIEQYNQLLERSNELEQFYIQQVKERTDLTEQERENEITKIQQRFETERKEIQDTVNKIVEANEQIQKEQENIGNEISKKYQQLFATIFDNLANISSQVTTELNNYLDKQQGYIDNYITRLSNMYNVQQALLGKVSDLQLDKINREIAQAEAEKRRIEKQKEAIETVNTLLQTYNSYLQAGNTPQQALLNSIKDILLIKTISRAIKGRFAKGVEGFKGVGTDTSDENLVLISNNESIVTAQATKKYKGLVTAMNAGKVNDWIQQNSVTNYGKEYVYDFMRLGNSIVSLVKTNNKYTIK